MICCYGFRSLTLEEKLIVSKGASTNHVDQFLGIGFISKVDILRTPSLPLDAPLYVMLLFSFRLMYQSLLTEQFLQGNVPY